MNLQPWQEDVLIKMKQYKGKGVLQITGRQTGKSQWSSQAIDRLMQDILSVPLSDLKLSEGTVYGSRYHTVEPIGGSWKDMELWCSETFGTTAGSIWSEDKAPNPAQRWYMNNRKFWFREEKDRTMFVLKWR
jgi:acid phosphatase class B